MPVPITMADLAPVAGNNYPVGSEPIGNNLDNYLRAHAALIRQGNAIASSSMPSGSTVNVANANGESVLITGSSTITSLGTGFVGCKRELRFSGSPTLVHSSNLQLPGNQNVIASPDHVLTFRCIGSNTWLCTGGKIRGIQDVPGLTDATTSVKGIQRNATNAEAQAGAINNATITPASLASAVQVLVPDATLSVAGRIAIADGAETSEGTSYTKAVVPGRLKPLLDAKVGADHKWDASSIESGTLPVARGGTGLGSLTSGSYLRGSGTGAVALRSPSQVASDINAAILGANVFPESQTIRNGGNAGRKLIFADGSETVVAEVQGRSSGGLNLSASVGPIWLSPNGTDSSAGRLSVTPDGNMSVSGSVTASGGFQFSGGPRVPRTFVQSGTPTGASDGDLWIW